MNATKIIREVKEEFKRHPSYYFKAFMIGVIATIYIAIITPIMT